MDTLTRLRPGVHDPDTPLHEVTFCAVDLETTGGSPKACEIVEIGAIRSRGGEALGTFETLVRPDAPMPVEMQVLTGIRQSMLDTAAPLPAVLPAFLEFSHAAVFVAHNAGFDHAFLREACRGLDYEPPRFEVLDTYRLAKRLVRGETRDHKLHTLAAHMRVTNTPNHRAFPDAAACLEILYGLMERASAYGARTLGELMQLQQAPLSRHLDKARLARDLPRTRGVYLFGNARGETIYVGKAADLKARVRSYFVSDERKQIGDLRLEATSVRAILCPTDLEARALEARLIERLRPRYNRQGVRRSKAAYLRLDTRQRHPRFRVASRAGPADVGPFASSARARAAGEALAATFGVRTCTLDLKEGTAIAPCPLYELGACCGPCTGRAGDIARHEEAVAAMRADVDGGLEVARSRVLARLARLAEQQRFEEAVAHRDAFDDLARVLAQAQALSAIAAAGRVRVDVPGGRVNLEDGRLAASPDARAPTIPGVAAPPRTPDAGPLAPSLDGLEERRAVASWLARGPVRLLDAEHPLAHPWPRVVPLGE